MPEQTQDHLAAVKAEATEATATVVFRDAKFTINPPDEWLMDFVHYADREKVTLALEAALGPHQYETFRGMTPRPSIADAGKLIEQIVSTFNLNMGE